MKYLPFLHMVVRRRLVQAGAVLVFLYAAAGFLLLPFLVRRMLPRHLAPLLHREVTLARVRANPFTFSLTLDGFLIKDRDGSPLAGWDRLYLNVSTSSLIHLAPAFDEIRLEGFHARMVLDAEGNPSFADLLKPSASAPAKEGGAPPEVRIGRLTVSGARVDFLDQGTQPPFLTQLGPLNFGLDAFRLAQDSRSPYLFTGRTERGETFGWKGHLALEPLRSQGSFFIQSLYLPKYAPFYREDVAFTMRTGTLDLKADYDLQWGEGRKAVLLHRGEAALHGFSLEESDHPGPVLELPALQMAGLEADLLESRARVASVALRDGKVQVVRDADGVLNLQRLARTRKPKPKDEKPFTFDLDDLRLENMALAFVDRVPRKPVNLALDRIGLTVHGLSLDPAKACDLDLNARWNGRGSLKVAGKAAPLRATGSLELAAQALDLAPLAGYLEPEASLQGGSLTGAGHVDFDLPASRGSFQGRASLDGFRMEALPGHAAQIAWKTLRLEGIQANQTPPSLRLASLELEGPAIRYVQGPESAVPAVPGAGKPAATPGPAPRVEIGAVRVKGGSMAFVDRSVQPPAALSLEALEGRVGRLSTDPAARADLELRAKVDGAAPFRATGTVNLLSQAAYTDLSLVLDAMDLSPLGPYAGRYLGYGIEKGKLAMDMKYLVQARKLQGENRIKVDQFTLGESTNSPEAIHVPIKLGLALLRDRHGLIDLDVPVRGDLDSPDFRLGRVIWHAIVNVFAKVATSPFRAIGSLFGSGDADLSLLAFKPGSDTLDAPALQVLDTLRKALYQRPGLRLDLEGTFDSALDAPVLRRQELEAQLARRVGGELTSANRPKVLKAAYLETLQPPPDAKALKALPDVAPEAMEAKLLERIVVDEAAMGLLARRRVQAARDRLLADGTVEADRLFIVQGGERARKEGGAKVYFELK